MPDDDPPTDAAGLHRHGAAKTNPPGSKRGFFSVPPALKQLFDNFPIVTYDENTLPLRAPTPTQEHVLYIFASANDIRAGRPSFNPACLKWQTYLAFSDLPFRTVASNNHASPSGSLPFLLPAASSVETTAQSRDPIPVKRLRKWLSAQTDANVPSEPDDLRYEAYDSLLSHRLRKAWLYQLYLSPDNTPVVRRLYVNPCSRNPIVRATIERQLHRAAASEIVKASASNAIVEAELLRDAEDVFSALSTLLGQDEWLFGGEKPGLFDASVFAYTHPLLDRALGWRDNALSDRLRHHENLVLHRERILDVYY